ncbi:hypothetical protein HY256_10550, partial [Candidatus Sumerlaeota bacterium]|nr:hypothetical protein [Candidatus Sumerlaeota bacterium]
MTTALSLVAGVVVGLLIGGFYIWYSRMQMAKKNQAAQLNAEAILAKAQEQGRKT